MAGNFVRKNRAMLLKAEVTAGVDSLPVAGTDDLRVVDPRASAELEQLETEYATGSISASELIAGGGNASFTYGFRFKGAGTGGTAPEFGPSLRCAGLAETLQAADDTGTAQGGAAGSITLAVGASSTDDIHIGKTVTIEGGTGVLDERRVITDYDGTTKIATVYPDWTTPPDATTLYNIKANALYIPASTNLETFTAYLYQIESGAAPVSKLFVGRGLAGNFNFTMTARQLSLCNMTLQGIFNKPTEPAVPAGLAFDVTSPRALILAESWLGGIRVNHRELTFDLGNSIGQGDDYSEQFGFGPACITDRAPSGTINPLMVRNSEQDRWQELLDGNPQKFWLDWGDTDGNRFSIYMPTVRFSAIGDDDTEGLVTDGISYNARADDSEIYLSAY